MTAYEDFDDDITNPWEKAQPVTNLIREPEQVDEGYYPASHQESFSDEHLLAQGFERSNTRLRKQVGPSDLSDKPVAMFRVPLESMTTTWQPRMGYNTTPPPVSPRAHVLREAEQLITGDRNETYGTPTQNFTNIAALLNIQFAHKLKDGTKFTAADVAIIQMQTKLARMVAQPKRDNFVDLAGYAACGWECEEVEQQ